MGDFVAPACSYASILRHAQTAGIRLIDNASRFSRVSFERHTETLDPFDFQIEAIKAWEGAERRGIVALPTGAGKSYMTRLLIAMLGVKDSLCSTLVIVPTRILLYQWHAELQRAFRQPIGIVGDDILDLRPITVTTYASARIHMSWFGDRWKLIVFDELHRKLSGGPSGNSARFSLAPFRLGLTATPVEQEQTLLNELVGPVVYRRTTEEMIERDVLSVYRRVEVHCKPSAEEVRTYFELRGPMDRFWRDARSAHRIRSDDWFIRERRLRPDAAALALRSVLRAHRYWASIPSRFLRLRDILHRHRDDRILVFAESRASAYEISRQFLIPPITADIGADEREVYLGAFAEGTCRVLVTARALEEGVDLPSANIAVILAGRKTRRAETIRYIQRRGRVLRKRAGKHAVVYEVSWSIPKKRGEFI
jgi:superfamily II DNA or RNA helicase